MKLFAGEALATRIHVKISAQRGDHRARHRDEHGPCRNDGADDRSA